MRAIVGGVLLGAAVGWGFLAPALDLRRARTLTLRSLGGSYLGLLAQFPSALWEATKAAFTRLWIVSFGIVLGIIVMWFGVFAALVHAVFGDNPAGYLGWMWVFLLVAVGASLSLVRTVRGSGIETKRHRHQAQ